VWGRAQLFSLVALFLAVVALAWMFRGGFARRNRLWVVTIGLLMALGVLARRMGWGEVAVLAVLAFVPLLMLPARKERPGGQ
jgi:hypothetical protein